MAQDSTTENIMTPDYYDWAGIDHLLSPFLEQDNSLIQSVNFTSTDSPIGFVGAKTTRQPYSQVLDVQGTDPIQNLIYASFFDSNNNQTTWLIKIQGGQFYAVQLIGTQTSWGVPVSGFVCTNPTKSFGYTFLNNLIHLGNGVDPYQTWNPTIGFVQDPSGPIGSVLTTFQERVYVGNITNATSYVEFSSSLYEGALGESTFLAANSNAGDVSLTILDPIFTNPSTTNPIPAVIGSGTTSSETVAVTGQSGTTSPYTISLQQPLVNAHSANDVIQVTAPWFADVNNAATAGYIGFDPGYNGGIVALDVVAGNLIVHKASGGFYIYDGSSISSALQSVSPFFNAPGTPTTSPFSLDQISGIEFYLNRDGVYSYQGGYPLNISYQVLDYIQNMQGTQYATAPGIAFSNKYYVYIGTVTDKYGYTTQNCVLVYDFILNIWDTYSLLDQPTVFCKYIDNDGNQRLIFGTNNGKVMQFGDGIGDAGLPNTALLQTNYLTMGAPERTKDVQSYCFNTNKGANFQLQYATDWKNNWQTFSAISGYTTSDNAPSGMKDFKSIAFRLIANTTVPCTFMGFTLKVSIGSRRTAGRRV